MNPFFKKLLATVLAIVMLVSVMSANVFAAETQNQEPDTPVLVLDQEQTANISEGGDIAYFKFVPEEDGYYSFTSISEEDTCGYLYNSDLEELVSDDDSGNGVNFLIENNLKAEKTYYFGVRFNDESTIGNVSVKLTKKNVTSNIVVKTIISYN